MKKKQIDIYSYTRQYALQHNKVFKKKVNVFCEKPFNQVKEAQSLIELSRRIKSRLYVDDIENYKKKR